MKISAKGRYGLAAMTELAGNYSAGRPLTTLRISERLGISKIYLEQVFSLLKRAQLVLSMKGSQGGYQLARPPEEITAYDILSAIELTLTETASEAFEKLPALGRAIEKTVYAPLDAAIREALSAATLADLLAETERESHSDTMMFYI